MPIDRNLAPETVLTGVPGDSTTTFYRLRLYWAGYDRDGEVVGFEWAVTDSTPDAEIPYRYTTRTDTTIVFTVEESHEILGHRFYLRAVDNEGKRDPVPAWTFFAVRNNCVPLVWYTRAEALGPGGQRRPLTSTNSVVPTDTIPAGWGVIFSWGGSDCDRALTPDGHVITVGDLGYDYRLGPFELDPIVVGAGDTTRTYEARQLHSGVYEMRVRSRDDAGLSSIDPALRTFVWNFDPVTRFAKALIPPSADSVASFEANTGGANGEWVTHADGDTLPLTAFGVVLKARVLAYDPDAPNRITAVQARLIKDATFWTDLGSDQTFSVTNAQFTGDYRLMARSLDGHGSAGRTPCEILFYINHPPRYRESWIYNRSLSQVPLADQTYPAPLDTVLKITVGAQDPDLVGGVSQGLQFQYRFDLYPTEAGAPGQETIYRSAWVLGDVALDNVSFLEQLRAKLQVTGTPPTRPRFIPGEYVIRVIAREKYSSADEARFGYREAERSIHFWLQ